MNTRYIIAIGIILVLLIPFFSSINTLPTLDENTNAAWSQVSNEYKRRADLIPNLVSVVKGYATHEDKIFNEVTEARSKALQLQADKNLLTDETKMHEFQKYQSQLSSSLSRLIAVVENYPNLKANENFLALQSQIEGSENRIAVARRDYINAVRIYNTALRTFPTIIWAKIFYSDLKTKANLSEDESVYETPQVKF